jgi:hypothetical protein
MTALAREIGSIAVEKVREEVGNDVDGIIVVLQEPSVPSSIIGMQLL